VRSILVLANALFLVLDYNTIMCINVLYIHDLGTKKEVALPLRAVWGKKLQNEANKSLCFNALRFWRPSQKPNSGRTVGLYGTSWLG
jgi:hypothetical protein